MWLPSPGEHWEWYTSLTFPQHFVENQVRTDRFQVSNSTLFLPLLITTHRGSLGPSLTVTESLPFSRVQDANLKAPKPLVYSV